ncbi:MAG: leucine-rich repeat domain-containing protein [Prevotella sp.]|nr:leucine-rich repeat domain-containing protein [Prevotella sp.]
MKTKLMKSLLTIACLLSSIGVSAYDITVNGIYYNIESFTDMTCSVTYGDVKYEGDITIPEKVTYNNRTLTVISIGASAFEKCSNLTSVNIPNSVTNIGSYAFMDCSNLVNITVPNSLTNITERAFCNCSNLTNITIPNTVQSIGQNAFSGTGITNITIPNSVTYIGMGAFMGCQNLTNVTIPNSVTYIGKSLFYGCSNLTSVTIPNSIKNIEDLAFYNCISLTNITIPNSIKIIGESAFGRCTSLKNISIPSSVNSIKNSAFEKCSMLEKLVIEDGENTLDLGYNTYDRFTLGKGLFYDCPLKYLYVGRKLSYEKENSYGRHPFYNCIGNITEITFGQNITEIQEYIMYSDKLETITLHNPTPPSVPSSAYFTNAQYMNLNVYVPKGSLEAYQKANVWQNFWGLQEKELTGMETVVADDCNTDNVIYDMQGRRLDAPKAGLNIINGKKVMIRK